ncbi:MAG: hypothetical protein HKN82_17920, partial [Akkermansiaceae bacterium]|nr:hypothetical protein [Akkermansiaceae bacterium]
APVTPAATPPAADSAKPDAPAAPASPQAAFYKDPLIEDALRMFEGKLKD